MRQRLQGLRLGHLIIPKPYKPSRVWDLGVQGLGIINPKPQTLNMRSGLSECERRNMRWIFYARFYGSAVVTAGLVDSDV